MRNLLLILFTLVGHALAFGQQSDTIWYNKKWEKTDRTNKHYYRVIQHDTTTSAVFFVQDFYPSGQLQMKGYYSSLSPEKRDGSFTWWFQNGSVQREAVYKNDTIVKLTDWDENGKIVRQQEYVKTLTYLDGEAIYDLKSIEVAPEFPRGKSALFAFISDNLQYPKEAAENDIQGKVVVMFVVDRKGKVRNPEIFQGVHELLDQEALRVIGVMPKWKPGKQEGKNVNVRFALPITFKSRY